MDETLSSAPPPATRPIQGVLEMLLEAAEKIGENPMGSAAMLRDVSLYIWRLQEKSGREEEKRG